MNEIQKARYEVWMWRKIFKRIIIPVFLFLLVMALVSFVYALRAHQIIHGNTLIEQEHESEQIPKGPEYKPEEEWPERVVFLTFDDGPSWNTARILDILAAENAPSIFFVVGNQVVNHPEAVSLMDRTLAEGHYIGLHSMTHNQDTMYAGYEAPSRFVDEMLQLQALIYDEVSHFTSLCRAPYGMMGNFTPEHERAAAEAGIKCIDWNIDPQDWRNSAELAVQYVIDQVEMLDFPSELVIVLHEQDATVEALPTIISFLRSHGYVFKTYPPGHEFVYRQYRYRLR